MKTAKKVAVKKIAKKPVAIKKQQQKNKGKVTKIVTTVVTTTQTTSNNKPTKKKTTIVKSVAAPKKVATPIKAALPLPKTSTSNGNNNNINVPSQTTDDVKIVKAVSKGGAIVDLNVPGHSEYHVVPDTKNQFNGKFFDATLNCSDLGQNNNKFYIIQVIAKDSNPNQCYLWNRWGRIGVVGQNAFSAALSQDQAVNLFMSKYRSKTSSKYTQIEIDYSNKDEEKKVTKKEEKKTVKESKLPQKVQDFINLIYNLNMMKNSMMEVGYDANKMPLGKLGPKTLKEGYNVLKAIETELRGKKNPTVLSNLSSDFYTLIPHNFGF